jgi:ribosome-binding protein aMBF1 (putative translation factor)
MLPADNSPVVRRQWYNEMLMHHSGEECVMARRRFPRPNLQRELKARVLRSKDKAQQEAESAKDGPHWATADDERKMRYEEQETRRRAQEREMKDAEVRMIQEHQARKKREYESLIDRLQRPEPKAVEAKQEQKHEWTDRPWREIINERIQEHGWSINGLGAEAGISPSVLSRFMRGERSLTMATLEKLCSALKLGLGPIKAE